MLVYNPGAAFSFLSSAPGWQRFLFIAIALGASAWIVYLLARHGGRVLDPVDAVRRPGEPAPLPTAYVADQLVVAAGPSQPAVLEQLGRAAQECDAALEVQFRQRQLRDGGHDVPATVVLRSADDEPASPRDAWRVLQRPSFRAQPVVELVETGGAVESFSVVDPYPSRSWEPGELVVARLPVPTGATGDRVAARAALGFMRGGPAQRMTIDDPLALYGQTRVIGAR